MELTVYYYDPLWGLLWGEADGRTGFIPCGDVPLPLKSGQRVRLKGTVVPDAGLTGRTVEVTVLAENAAPAPIDATGILTARERLSQRIVSLKGQVMRALQPDAHHAVWELASQQQKITARVQLAPGESAPEVENRWVELTGVYVIKDNEIELWVSGPKEAREIPPPLVGEGAAAAANTVITTLTQYWEMPPSAEGKAHPASLELLVHYYDPAWGLLWAESGGTPAFIPCVGPVLPLKSRQRVRLEGTLLPGVGIPGDQVRITVLEEQAHLEVQPVAGMIADVKRFERRMVSLQGVVDRQSEADLNHAVWDIISEGHLVTARMPLSRGQTPPRLEGKLVEVRGVYSPKIDPSGDVFAIDLWVPSPAEIQVTSSLEDDPRFDRGVTPIDRIEHATGLVRIVGTLRDYEPGRRAVLRDTTGHADLAILQSQPLHIGQRVEAIGFSAVTGLRRTLTAAVIRPMIASDEESIQLTGNALELRTADRLLELSPAEAASARPVEILALVTWSHPGSSYLWVQDSSGGARVERAEPSQKPPAPGTLVVVRGTTASGAYAPFVTQATFEQRGAMILPLPPVVSLEQALVGNLEGQRVEMQGYVSDVSVDGPWRRMTLSTASGEFFARVPSDVDLAGLRGSVTRVRGVVQALANDRRQLTGIQLWAPDTSHVRVEAAAPSSHFSIPQQSIASLRQFSSVPAFNRWVHVRGTVLLHKRDQLFIEQDGDGMLVLERSDEGFLPGDLVEAVGLPGLQGRRAVLREAVVRRVGSGPAPEPTELRNVKPFYESLDNRLVTTRATLVSLLHQSGEVVLALSNNGVVFNAQLPLQDGLQAPADWAPGSELQVAGLYRLDFDARAEPQSFRLLLRSPANVTLVKSAPWWTLSRTFGVVSFLFGAVVLGLAWALSLRQRVQRQTDLIRGQLAKEANLEARNRSIVENASDFIFTTDIDGRFTAFNPAGERITGYRREEAMRMNLRDLIASAEDAVLAHASLRPEDNGGATFQTRLRTRDGREVWVEISSRCIAENGRVTGVLGIVRDISERKLFEDRLEKARDAAEASARAKSAFLATMSHEIRTPMNGVIGVANLLLDTSLTDEQRDFAETIRSSADSLLTILNDILDFSKIEAGKLAFETVHFDLTDTVEGALDLLAARAAAKHLELVSDISATLPQRLVGDPGRVRQVLLNLLGNAVKFTDHGEIVVAVREQERSADQVLLRFEVRDTGIGLTPDERERLFQPFSQADTSTTRRFGGTGLGLAICRQLTEMMGGTIGVESEKGRGSTFWFTIRLPYTAEPSRPSGLPERLRKVNVLVVDHHDVSTRVLCAHLSEAGVSHTRCSDAPSALAMAAAHPAETPLVVLLNATSVEIDAGNWGLALAAQDGRTPPPTLLLCPVDRHFSREQLTAAGYHDVLPKPVHRRDLLQAIDRLAGGAGTATPFAPTSPARVVTALAREGAARALIVEDNAVNQRVARVVLERMGFRVELASNGFEALEAIERTDYDFVLMDCQMPEMDGYEATRRIRQGRHRSLRIVAMTANAMEGDRDRCLAAGMDDYVSKPMRVEELRGALERCAVLQERTATDRA